MLTTLFWDFGGVLVRTTNHTLRLAWDERLGLPAGSVEERFFNSPEGRAAQRGETSEEAHWAWLARSWGLSPADARRLRHDFWAADQLDDRLIAFIRQLRPRYKIGLISNAMDSLRHDLTHRWGIGDLFDSIIISAEEHCMKPDPVIYQRALTRLTSRPEATVFIDDFLVNVVGAQAVGMHAIHYRPDMDVYVALAQLDVA